LISQQFYDVESVLLGGTLGSTNTAVSIIIALMLLIFVVLIVLIRRGNAKDEEWDEEEFYEVSEDDEERLVEGDDHAVEVDVGAPEETTVVDSTNVQPQIEDAIRQKLATKAGQVGVMQAAPGTQQGDTGWYVDESTEVQYWKVGPYGSWTRVQ